MSGIATDIDGVFFVGTLGVALDLVGIVEIAPAPQTAGDDLRFFVVNQLTRNQNTIRWLILMRKCFARRICRQAAFDRLTKRLQLTVFLELIHQRAEQLVRVAIQQIDCTAGAGVCTTVSEHGGGRREQRASFVFCEATASLIAELFVLLLRIVIAFGTRFVC